MGKEAKRGLDWADQPPSTSTAPMLSPRTTELPDSDSQPSG
jgi:hypothetical protein